MGRLTIHTPHGDLIKNQFGGSEVKRTKTRPDLPTGPMTAKDNVAVIIDRYIAHLLEVGLEAETAAIGTLYTALVRGNYMSVPTHSFLHKS